MSLHSPVPELWQDAHRGELYKAMMRLTDEQKKRLVLLIIGWRPELCEKRIVSIFECIGMLTISTEALFKALYQTIRESAGKE